MDLPSLKAMVLIAIQDGSVNGVELQKQHNLHVLMVLSEESSMQTCFLVLVIP